MTSHKFSFKSKKKLVRSIQKYISEHGPYCDLNFIDVSVMTDLSSLWNSNCEVFGPFQNLPSELRLHLTCFQGTSCGRSLHAGLFKMQ